MKRKYLTLILALFVMISMSTVAFAATTPERAVDGISRATMDLDPDDDDVDNDDEDADLDDDEDADLDDDEDADLDDEEDADLDDEEDNDKENQIGQATEDLKDQREAREDLKDQIEEQLEEAIEDGNTALVADLEAQLKDVETKIEALKEQYKTTVQTRKDLVKARYTDEEIDVIEEAENKIESDDPKVTVLEFDSIFSNLASFIFDTPPVIKEGRTLVPVRAITEGFGADVTYANVTKTVTIIKNGITISFVIGSNAANVNGQEVVMDTKAGITNNRTYVPLRFVLETFDLDVKWDNETRTIEIDDPAVTTTTTTPAAI